MFKAGEVVSFFSPTAGKLKYHLCLGEFEDGPRFVFLHINSGKGFRGDCILDDGRIPGLPKSPTGETVVSFANLVRMGDERLAKFDAKGIGVIDAELAGELSAFAKTVGSLTASEKKLVLTALQSLFT